MPIAQEPINQKQQVMPNNPSKKEQNTQDLTITAQSTMIESILTYHVTKEKEIVFLFHRFAHTDDIPFACTNDRKHMMNKQDKRKMNQHMENPQGKCLYKNNTDLLPVLDKMEKL